jgi:hypothetical protein
MTARRTLPLILIIAVALRLAVALYLGDIVDAPPLLTDQRSYHALAESLIAGRGFTFDRPFYPFGLPAGSPTAHWSFLYSIFVAAIYGLVGPHPLAVRLLQAALGGILLPLLTYRLTLRLMAPARPFPVTASRPSPQAVALLSAAVAAIYAYFVLYSATLMTETLYIAAVLWSLERSLSLDRHLSRQALPSWPLILSFALSLGLATLLRQSFLPWAALLFLYLAYLALRLPLGPQVRRSGFQPDTRLRTSAFQPGTRLRTSAFQPGTRYRRSAFQPGTRLRTSASPPVTPPRRPATFLRLTVAAQILVAAILPWTLRNYSVFGSFLLLNSNTGYALYSAQHPMHGVRFQEFAAAPLPDDLPRQNEAQLDRELLRRGFAFILADPGRYLLLSLSRVRAYFEFWPTPGTTLLHNIGRTASFGLFLPLMLYGLYLARRQSLLWPRNSLLLLFIVFYSLLHILTWAMVRYRLPVDAALIPFAGLALAGLAARMLPNRRWIWTRDNLAVRHPHSPD